MCIEKQNQVSYFWSLHSTHVLSCFKINAVTEWCRTSIWCTVTDIIGFHSSPYEHTLNVSPDNNTLKKWQEKSSFLLHFMQLFYIKVRTTGQLISQMLPRIKLKSPRICVSFPAQGCSWLFPRESQALTKHSHPSQSFLVAWDDRPTLTPPSSKLDFRYNIFLF